jgi:hypothetical protein
MRSPAGALGAVDADCEIGTACPAIVSVPVLAAEPPLAETRYRTEPLPLPLLPLRIVIQEPDRVAIHVQPDGAVTVMVIVPPGGLTPWLVGEIVYVHPPFWETANVDVPTVIVPVREADELFPAIEYSTVPVPVRDPDPVTVNHPAEL